MHRSGDLGGEHAKEEGEDGGSTSSGDKRESAAKGNARSDKDSETNGLTIE